MIKHSGNKTQESTPKQWSLKFRTLVFAWFKGWGPISILCRNLSSVSQETHLLKIWVECCHLQQKWHMDNQVQWNHQDYAPMPTRKPDSLWFQPAILDPYLGHLRSLVVISTYRIRRHPTNSDHNHQVRWEKNPWNLTWHQAQDLSDSPEIWIFQLTG